jgi:hypothetical protein
MLNYTWDLVRKGMLVDSIEKLKKVSNLVRMLVFGVVALTFTLALYGYITQGVWWISIGDEQFNQLWEQYPAAQFALIMITAPSVIALIAGVYWLQRLLFELSQGLFFSQKCMACLRWLAWLSFFGVLYEMLWPMLATMVISELQAVDVNIRPLKLMAVLCLPVLVHLFSAAKELDEENKEII